MRPFIHDDFLLSTDVARELYHGFAARPADHRLPLPPPGRRDRRGPPLPIDHRDLAEGDHYKWRAMRTNGVAERFCTGDATDWEKFEAWARTVPATLRNPLYHWTHMELKRPFGIDLLLDERTARGGLRADATSSSRSRASRRRGC